MSKRRIYLSGGMSGVERADYLRLLNDRDTLQRLIAEYRGNRSLDNVLTTVLTKLEIEHRRVNEDRNQNI